MSESASGETDAEDEMAGESEEAGNRGPAQKLAGVRMDPTMTAKLAFLYTLNQVRPVKQEREKQSRCHFVIVMGCSSKEAFCRPLASGADADPAAHQCRVSDSLRNTIVEDNVDRAQHKAETN